MKFLIALCVPFLLLNIGERIHGQASDVNQASPYTGTTEKIPFTKSIGDSCSELNCTKDEQCEEKNGIYGCSCKNSQQTANFDFTGTCESSYGSMSLSRCQLFDAGFPTDILHLNDPNCTGTVRDGKVEFYFDNNNHICGTILVDNGTHFVYENFIMGESGSGPVIDRKKSLKISFSCAYSLGQNFSMGINPLGRIVQRTLPAGQGTYQVRMIPYQDAEFSQPFSASVTTQLNQQIFVEVCVDGVDKRQFASVIDTCWATPVNDPAYPVHWDLIAGMCPNPNDVVEILQNGVSTSSRFSFNMFVFTENTTYVYLHCTIHLCFLTNNNCSVDCGSGHQLRERRSVNFQDSTFLTVGPLMAGSEGITGIKVQSQASASMAASLTTSLMMIVVAMINVLKFF